MRGRWRVASVIGVSCMSLCALGLPLLVLWLPALGLGWLLDERITRVMLVMFLGMYVAGAIGAFRRHHRRSPLALAVVGSGLLVGTTRHLFPRVAGWAALASLVLAWFWDLRLLKKVHCSPDR